MYNIYKKSFRREAYIVKKPICAVFCIAVLLCVMLCVSVLADEPLILGASPSLGDTMSLDDAIAAIASSDEPVDTPSTSDTVVIGVAVLAASSIAAIIISKKR